MSSSAIKKKQTPFLLPRALSICLPPSLYVFSLSPALSLLAPLPHPPHLCISVFFEGFIIVNLTPNNNKRRWVLNEIAFVKSIIFSSVSLWSLSFLPLLLYTRMKASVIINFVQLKMVIQRVSFLFKFTVKSTIIQLFIVGQFTTNSFCFS